MKFSRDGMLLWLGALAALAAYLSTKGDPRSWVYHDYIDLMAFAAAWGLGKLQASPLESNVNLKLQHPNSTVLTLLLSVGLVFGMTGCAKNHLQEIQVSHDSLALAQDLEAQLCWGVAKVTDPVPDRTHCTTAIAGTIGLTDMRHQSLNARLAQAFTVHKSVTTQLATGATNVDLTTLTSLINEIVNDLNTLKQTPEVQRLTQAVQSGKVVK
jgi:hypothetical protein